MTKIKNTLNILLLVILISESSNAQDWANLNRFKNENVKLPTPTLGENRIVFMGNSITQGWGEICPEFFSSEPYVNRGIGGQTTPQMLVRFRADVINLKPKVVIILAGTNDIAGNTGPSSLEMIADNIFSMAELAKANDIKVILCSVLPVFDYPWSKGLSPNKKIPILNEIIKTYVASNFGMIYLDYFSAMVDDQNGLMNELTHDGVHPNENGYKIMAPLVEQAILKALQN